MALVDYGKGTRELDTDALQKQLEDAASQKGVKYDDSDYQGILRNISYDTGGMSLDDALKNQMGIYDERASNVPVHPGDSGPGGTGGPGPGGHSGGTGTNYPRDGGSASANAQFDDLMGVLKGMNTSPDVNLAEYDFPDLTMEVPGENLSPGIDDVLLDLMGRNDDPLNLEGRYRDELDGTGDSLGIADRIRSLLDRTQGGGVNSQRLQTRNEQAREQLTRGEEGALADVRGTLADRGLISMPGSPQGLELDATTRAFEPLQRAYLDNLRTSEVDESQRADEAEKGALDQGMAFESQRLDALSRATGWSLDQVNSRLSAAKTAQERQGMMADIALQQLDKNMAWNKFLAEYGLQREQVAEQIKAGRIAAIAPVINMFMALIGQSRGGYI